MDTGPPVAYLVANGQHHVWATKKFTQLPHPYLTCEAVLSEACFLVGRGGLSPEIVLEALAHGVTRLDFSRRNELSAVRRLLTQYRTRTLRSLMRAWCVCRSCTGSVRYLLRTGTSWYIGAKANV